MVLSCDKHCCLIVRGVPSCRNVLLLMFPLFQDYLLVLRIFSSFCPTLCNIYHDLQETTPSVINWQDYDGRTALHLAVAEGTKDVVNVLVSIVFMLQYS